MRVCMAYIGRWLIAYEANTVLICETEHLYVQSKEYCQLFVLRPLVGFSVFYASVLISATQRRSLGTAVLS